MPAVVGIVQVNSIGSSSVFHIGDVFSVAPQSVTKTFAGAGSFNTGDGLYVVNHYSNTNAYDQEGIDMPIAFTL
ncbi:MAG TPA: spore germination protein [Bacillus sp. (in: firmicutes)]|uniref:spore germination protein n=1 Tax=Bacillus litorisediminis TaxID=2922713 RepID=UPI001FAC80D3|nr:spore germination protein [Bacillus litorisediminis]HWO75073.1 spore germination protein [Bacillus sp. (in: firmicutes)]